MSKKIVLAASLALAFVGVAQAQTLTCSCDSSAVRLDSAALQLLLPNKMVCGSANGEAWQEWHGTGNALWDFKLGASDPRDPSKVVGTWSIGANTVNYNYGGAASFTYEVCATNGGTYTYCGQSVITGLRIGGNGSLQACNAVVNSASIVRSLNNTKR